MTEKETYYLLRYADRYEKVWLSWQLTKLAFSFMRRVINSNIDDKKKLDIVNNK